jgi:hypothetical protein
MMEGRERKENRETTTNKEEICLLVIPVVEAIYCVLPCMLVFCLI